MKMIEMQHGQTRAPAQLIGDRRLARSTRAHNGNAFHQRPPYSSKADGTCLVSGKTESDLQYGAKVEKGET
jgi:hypothetical protein